MARNILALVVQRVGKGNVDVVPTRWYGKSTAHARVGSTALNGYCESDSGIPNRGICGCDL